MPHHKLKSDAAVLKLPASFPGRQRLTGRECEVLELIAGGWSNKEAARARVSPRTVEVHRAHIMEKLGARNSVELVQSSYPRSGELARRFALHPGQGRHERLASSPV